MQTDDLTKFLRENEFLIRRWVHSIAGLSLALLAFAIALLLIHASLVLWEFPSPYLATAVTAAIVYIFGQCHRPSGSLSPLADTTRSCVLFLKWAAILTLAAFLSWFFILFLLN